MTAARPDFIVFSDDWGEHPSSCQHLFRHISRDHRVIWVNTIGMRDPKWSPGDFRKILLKVSKMLRGGRARHGSEDRAANVHVIQPMMLPYSGLAMIRAFNRWSVIRSVRALAARLGFEAPVVVSTVPNACDVVDAFDARKIVYYCVDDFSLWPGLNRPLVERMEDRLIGKADRLLATSRRLYSRLVGSGRDVTLFSHGVDLELFGSPAAALHPLLAKVPAPRVGYFGLFDERSDQALLAGVAEAMPKVSFVFTGPVNVKTAVLRRLSNVHFTGPVPYAELPSVIFGLRVLLIPYKVERFTDAISPLKLKEYLATGMPVISTSLAEALAHEPYLHLADGVEAWTAAVHAALSGTLPHQRSARAFLEGDSWVAKARQLLALSSA
jgi:glycosyltransferase involved in cell wall biosynthesis